MTSRKYIVLDRSQLRRQLKTRLKELEMTEVQAFAARTAGTLGETLAGTQVEVLLDMLEVVK